MGAGGIIIIRNSIVATAKLGTVTDNLTPAECKDRDTLCAKDALDEKDLKCLFSITMKAYKRLK